MASARVLRRTGHIGLGWAFGFGRIVADHKNTRACFDDDYTWITPEGITLAIPVKILSCPPGAGTVYFVELHRPLNWKATMEFLKKIIKSLLIGSLVGCGIAIISRFIFQDVIDRLEYVTYYMRYRWIYSDITPRKKKNFEHDNGYGISIVDIDDRSMQKMGLYWNWNRGYQAELINQLSAHFPAAIVYDILFGTEEDENHRKRLENLLVRSHEINPDIILSDQLRKAIIKTIDYDKMFIDATRKAGCVYHGICLADENDYPSYALSQVQHKMTTAWHDSLNPESTLMFPDASTATIRNKKTILDGIIPPLAQAACAIGHVDIIPNEDGVIREIPLFYRFGENAPIYLPISVRTVASLFATPNKEIRFVPGKYLDIGTPFKVFMDSHRNLSYSYPNVTNAQIRALLRRGDEICNLQPDKKIDITSYMAATRDENGCVSLEMNVPGTIPCELTNALLGAGIDTLLAIAPKEQAPLGPDIILFRDNDTDWRITAPFDAGEWYFTTDDLATIAQLDSTDLLALHPGKRQLIFYQFSVHTTDNNDLVSSLPCLRNETLRELCRTPWATLQSLQPGTRMDFGKHVRIPLTRHNYHIITFFGPKSKPFTAYSFYEIFSNRVQGFLEGKIFVVGSTAPAMFDIKAVPHDRSYPAVEIHASLMNSFLTNTFVKRLDGWADFVILLGIGIIIGFFSYLFKPLIGATLTLLCIVGYFLAAMTIFGADLLWIEIARPLLVIIFSFTAVMVYRYITEEKDRKFLQSTFKQYLSPELIDMMYKSRQQPLLGGEEGVRTAFFTDIQGFSTFSEELGSPTRLVELLNEYLGIMTDTLLSHYGTLDKYEGDAIIAFFGAPMPMEDHAYQACLTALDMQGMLGKLRTKWKNEGDKWPEIVHRMRMRIGINTGQITTGNMGSAIRKSYTMMGDAVNLAARLESASKQYGVYTMISEYTYAMVQDRFVVRQVDKITVMGKSEPVTVYELLAKKEDASGAYDQLLDHYTRGLNYFYSREWSKALDSLKTAEALEPCRDFAPHGMSPSKKILEYCQMYQSNPPDASWNGVMRLSSK